MPNYAKNRAFCSSQLVKHEYLRADNNHTKKAKFASFLTGYSENTFRQQWSNIHWQKDKDGVAWEKDMKIVRDFFQELGLPLELIKQIDNDLNL